MCLCVIFWHSFIYFYFKVGFNQMRIYGLKSHKFGVKVLIMIILDLIEAIHYILRGCEKITPFTILLRRPDYGSILSYPDQPPSFIKGIDVDRTLVRLVFFLSVNWEMLSSSFIKKQERGTCFKRHFNLIE